MGKSHIEILTTQATHFFTAVLAHTKFEVFKLKWWGIGHFRLNAQLYAIGLKTMCHQFHQLSA